MQRPNQFNFRDPTEYMVALQDYATWLESKTNLLPSDMLGNWPKERPLAISLHELPRFPGHIFIGQSFEKRSEFLLVIPKDRINWRLNG